MSTPITDATRSLPTGTWKIDPSQTTITVTAKKLGLFKVPATLTVTSGTIEIDTDHQITSVEVTADAGSYTSGNPRRNDHIRSADFLDGENHPDLRFTADTVSRTAAGYQADGSVTVKATTSPIKVDISDVDVEGDRGSFVATASVDRTAIGVDKLPSLIIGRNLQLTVTATASIAES